LRDSLNILGNRRMVALLIAIFLLSGFSGLIYQSIWTHYLKLFLGHAAYAQSLVLATFMGGLALGSWWAARLTHSSRKLLIWYALAEAAVGLYALLFHHAFVLVVDFAFETLLPGLESVAVAQLIKWALAMALILPPSILLGTTFPLMAEGLIRRQPERRGRVLGLLYFTNSLGAALGVLVSGFVMIRLLGLAGTMYSAGVLNLLVATSVIAVLWLSDGKELPVATQESPGPGRAAHRRVHLLLLACAGLTGLASFIYELTWIRMLNMVLGSATHSFELMLASFILGLALGGWWIRRRIDDSTQPLRQLAWIQLAMGLLAAATVVLYNQLFDLMAFLMGGLARTGEGYVLFKTASMALAMAVMLPATFCAGMTLPLITATLSRYGYDERAVGHVYAINTLGAIVGVIITASILIPSLGLRLSLLSGAAIDLGLAVCLVGAAGAGLSRRWPIGFAAAGLLGLGLIGQWSSFDEAKMASSVYRSGRLASKTTEILFHRDGRSATVAVQGDEEGSLWIATNGKTDASIHGPQQDASGDEHTMTMLASLGMALLPAAQDAAVIGFGSGMTTHLLLGNSQLRQVDTIEIEPAMVEGAKQFGSRVARAHTDPRSQVYIEDAKTFFSTRQRRYDIIVSEPSNPWVSGIASLFSTEHYRRVKQHLNADGVYIQWLQLYEFDIELFTSVLKAFSTQFSDYALYAGAQSDLVIAGVVQGKLPALNPRFIAEPGLRAELARVGIENVADIAGRLITTKSMLAPFLEASPTPANSDFFPFVDQHAERARFVDADAADIFDLQRIWLLTNTQRQRGVIKLATPDGKTKLAKNIGDARFVQALFKNSLIVDPSWNIDLSLLAYENAVSVSRLLYRCNPAMVEASWFGDAVWLSDITSIYGTSGLITPFWRSLVQSKCFDKLSEPVQAAFRFFLAVSDRNDMEILREGKLIIDHNFDVPGFWSYRVLQMLAAYTRLQRPVEAATFIAYLQAGQDTTKLKLEARVLAAYLLSRGPDGGR
jgi:spermidine synthase